MYRALHLSLVSALLLTLAACGDRSTLPVNADVGPNPTLPPPAKGAIPTVNIAPAKGWPDGGKPVAAEGLAVNASIIRGGCMCCPMAMCWSQKRINRQRKTVAASVAGS